MKKITYLISLLLVFIKLAVGQEIFSPQPARLLTKFRFEVLTGGIVIIKGIINDSKDSLQFILDTGSAGISLDSATVDYLKLNRSKSDRTIRGIAGVRTVDFAYNNTLKLPGLTIDKLDFHINDYSLLSSVYGLQIDGIIGYSFFKQFIVKLNYDNGDMEVYTQGFMRYPSGGYTLKPAIAGLPMQYAKLKDDKEGWNNGRFYLDTGAGLCFLLSQEFVADSSLINPRRKIYKTMAEGMGGKKEMQITVLRDLKIGPYRFKNVPTYIFEDDNNVTNYPFLGGLIGNDILRRFNVIINYAKSEFHLLPNSHFSDFFDYSYNGFTMYADMGLIIVNDVIKGGPGDKGGLKNGDIVFSIENNLSNNLNTYKNMVQAANKKIKMIVRRNDEYIPLVIHVGSIK
jgi:predicted aspartyl protease